MKIMIRRIYHKSKGKQKFITKKIKQKYCKIKPLQFIVSAGVISLNNKNEDIIKDMCINVHVE